jgi:hypothetical protein
LRLELGAVFAPTSTSTADFVGDSVHVSTKSFVDTSILKQAGAFKVPGPDAYETTSELLTQTLAVLPVVGKEGATRNEIVTAARVPNDRTEPYEKEGFVWVGQLGLKFNTRGKFEKAVAGPQ